MAVNGKKTKTNKEEIISAINAVCSERTFLGTGIQVKKAKNTKNSTKTSFLYVNDYGFLPMKGIDLKNPFGCNILNIDINIKWWDNE